MNIPSTAFREACRGQFPLDGFEEVLLARSPKRSSWVCAELSYLPALTNPHPVGVLTLRWVQRGAWGDSRALRFGSLVGEQNLETCVPVSLNCTYKCTRACPSWGDGAVGWDGSRCAPRCALGGRRQWVGVAKKSPRGTILLVPPETRYQPSDSDKFPSPLPFLFLNILSEHPSALAVSQPHLTRHQQVNTETRIIKCMRRGRKRRLLVHLASRVPVCVWVYVKYLPKGA